MNNLNWRLLVDGESRALLETLAAWAINLSIDPVQLAPLGYPAIPALLDTGCRWTTCGTTELRRLIKIAKAFQYDATQLFVEQNEAGRILQKALPGYIRVWSVPVGIHERIYPLKVVEMPDPQLFTLGRDACRDYDLKFDFGRDTFSILRSMTSNDDIRGEHTTFQSISRPLPIMLTSYPPALPNEDTLRFIMLPRTPPPSIVPRPRYINRDSMDKFDRACLKLRQGTVKLWATKYTHQLRSIDEAVTLLVQITKIILDGPQFIDARASRCSYNGDLPLWCCRYMGAQSIRITVPYRSDALFKAVLRLFPLFGWIMRPPDSHCNWPYLTHERLKFDLKQTSNWNELALLGKSGFDKEKHLHLSHAVATFLQELHGINSFCFEDRSCVDFLTQHLTSHA